MTPSYSWLLVAILQLTSSYRLPPALRIQGRIHGSISRGGKSSRSSGSTHSSTENSVGNGPDGSKTNTNYELLSSIVDALNDGNVDELTSRGMKVTKKGDTPREELDQKLSDPDIKMQILGTLDEEEEEVLRLMQQQQEMLQTSSGYESLDIDPSLLAELQSDAQNSITSMQLKNNNMASLLNDKSLDGLLIDKVSGPNSIDRLGALPTDDSKVDWGQRAGTSDTLTPLGDSWESTAPPTVYSSFIREEVEEMAGDDDDDSSQDNGSREEERAAAKGDDSTNEAVFAQLLKATIEATEETSSTATTDVIQNTINAVNDGDMSKLDLNLVLGDALKSLTDQLNIDMREELSSLKNKEEMQGILAGGMAELVNNMKDLDEQSNALYARLETLQQELAAETAQFEEKKQDELNGLLLEQAKLQNELTKSVKNIKESTDKLESVMSDLENNADALTAIALFPFKPTSKKVSFVLGLALLLKVPFDISLAFSIRSADPSDWFGIAVQSGLCLALFHYYGLVQAVMRGSKSKT